tara:strand:- start:56 stop:670 length:615 start_codon:yes stop_codon:yes gene_type:complete
MSAIIPTTVLDDFFKKPENIIDFSKTIKYKIGSESPEINNNQCTIKRSDCLSIIHPPLYKHINNKVLSLFFEDNQFEVESTLRFQIIENDEDTGWIHQDPCLFTYIIYLSPDNEINRGTSLYKLKDKKSHFINNGKDTQNNTFDKILDVKDNFNRIVCFSSEMFHASNKLNNNLSPRLILIGFVHKVQNKNIFPITRFLQAQYW